MKQCKQCQTPKPKHDFYKMRGMLDGLQKICIECTKKKVRDKYWEEKELGRMIRI